MWREGEIEEKHRLAVTRRQSEDADTHRRGVDGKMGERKG